VNKRTVALLGAVAVAAVVASKIRSSRRDEVDLQDGEQDANVDPIEVRLPDNDTK
jgi:hypothetical protein